MYNRPFGIEIEFVGADRGVVANALRAAGVDAHVEGYNHNTRSYWKLVTDASLSHRSGLTGEIVSPILRGEDGFAQLKAVCDALATIPNLTVNRTCGLHVHLDCQDLTVAQIAKVFERYATYEDQIDLVMPRSRRESARWCRSIKDMPNEMKNKRTKAEQAYALGRYYKVNLTNIATRGAMEFRQHSGTTEYRKISNWVKFLMEFVNTSAQLVTGETNAPNKKRYFNEVRNVFENNDMSVIWSRGYNAWVVRRTSTNRMLGTITNEQMRECYAEQRQAVVCSKRDDNRNILTGRVEALVYSFTNDNDWDWNLSNAVCAGEAQDNGWLHGISQTVADYLEERREELN